MRKGKRFEFYKKIPACVLIVLMLASLIPWQFINVHADESDYVVYSVTLFKTFDSNRQIELLRVMITGKNLADVPVGIITSSGYADLGNRTHNTESLLQFDLNSDQLGSSIRVGGTEIPLNQLNMPTVTGTNKKVSIGHDDLRIQGTNLNQINADSTTHPNPAVTIGYEHNGAYTPVELSALHITGSTEATIDTPSGELGLQNIIFKKVEQIGTMEFPGGTYDNVVTTIQYTYRNQFSFVQDINIVGLNMRPNRGKAGDTVYFEAPHSGTGIPNPNLIEYDVFFVRSTDGTDPYTNRNKGQNRTYRSNQDGKDILTVKVPNIGVGEYFVVLTNIVSDSEDPSGEVVQEKVLSQKFTVIDSQYASTISSVQPNSGPDIGSQTTVSGKFFITMNVQEFVPDSDTITIESPIGDVNKQELVVDYGSGTYNGEEVISAIRKITVIIGSNTTFATNDNNDAYIVSYSPVVDTLTVRTPQVTDAETDPLKDVVVETVTTFTKSDFSTIIVSERAELRDGYTYIPSTLTPEISSVTPQTIQVEEVGYGEYGLTGDIMVAVHGDNFMVTKYIEDGQSVVSYPTVQLGDRIILDKNIDTDLNLIVLDKEGRMVDGSSGNEIGTKILITIPKNEFTIKQLGKTYAKVTNPVRGAPGYGYFAQAADMVNFVTVESNKVPVITSVKPSAVSIEGGETVNIEGSNFEDGVRVFIDGEEITGIKRQGDGKRITFTAPKGREGSTQLQVLNPGGGIAVFYPFKYVKTYTNPGIIDFAPKAGNTGTLVTIKGTNFMKPDPTASTSNLDRLIGTRVFLDDTEVNEYNLNAATKEIELRNYSALPGNELLRIESDASGNNKLVLADYYNAVVLRDASDENHFYTLDRNAKGTFILSDWAGNQYTLLLGNDRNSIIADPEGGSIVQVEVSDSTLVLGGTITLNIMTLYKVDDTTGQIVGNRVKVIDSTQINFTVPILYEGDKYYDLTIMNPDTKRDSRTGNRGFYYYGSAYSNPSIDSIKPDEGSVDGGYTITISGRNFEDSGGIKTRVFINGIEVSAKDVSISADLGSITVVVPPYPGDLPSEKGTSRLTVPVVVLNPSDGASASMEEGFTYVVPSSHPEIVNIVPTRGSATGGNIVEIIGVDFRYYESFDDSNRNQVHDPGEEWNDINQNKQHDDLTNLTGEPDEDKLEDDLREPVALHDNSVYKYYFSSPILPKVYFDGNLAKIVEYSKGYIKVLAPKGKAGTVDVFIVNNDSGTSNTVSYTYESSNPEINSILPEQGTRRGGDKIEIRGSNFVQSSIKVYTSAAEPEYREKSICLVRFGNITNRNIPREQENSGRIDNGRATVNLTGGLTVSYNAAAKTLSVALEDGGYYSAVFSGYSGDIRYIPTTLLTDSSGRPFSYNELIRVEVSDLRLIVERGYAPEVDYNRASQIVVTTPYYYTVGAVTVTLTNPDEGTASGRFEYKNPASDPEIVNITRDGQSPLAEADGMVLRVNYKGGSVIDVIGSDFREDAQIQIADILTVRPEDISYSLPGKLSFTMPAVPDSAVGTLYRLTVLNADGGSAFSDEVDPPIYILFTRGETSPSIKEVSPDSGSVNGGNTVIITGSDFRETMPQYPGKRISVYFGAVKIPDSNVAVIDYKTISAIVPSGTAGQVRVRVENPDGEQTHDDVIYTYISSPDIISVVDPMDPYENTLIATISIEGGEKIKIKGSGFKPGARVVFDPVVTELDNITEADDNIVYIKEQVYLLDGGAEGTDVAYIDSETLTVVTPAGKLGAAGIIVINPDSGASEEYDGLVYDLPGLGVPQNVVAELVYDRYIKVHWKAVEGAEEYEIYSVEEEHEIELVGSTALTSFLYSDLEPRTRYRFIVKAIGNFGPSQPSAESNTVRTERKWGIPMKTAG